MLTNASEPFGRLLDSVRAAIGREAAIRLAALRADPDVQQRLDELADCANEGVLTDNEREEYAALISAVNLLAILQALARELLDHRSLEEAKEP